MLASDSQPSSLRCWTRAVGVIWKTWQQQIAVTLQAVTPYRLGFFTKLKKSTSCVETISVGDLVTANRPCVGLTLNRRKSYVQKVIDLRVLWKLAHWQPYVSLGGRWVPTVIPTFRDRFECNSLCDVLRPRDYVQECRITVRWRHTSFRVWRMFCPHFLNFSRFG
jgi:hypothetical protein